MARAHDRLQDSRSEKARAPPTHGRGARTPARPMCGVHAGERCRGCPALDKKHTHHSAELFPLRAVVGVHPIPAPKEDARHPCATGLTACGVPQLLLTSSVPVVNSLPSRGLHTDPPPHHPDKFILRHLQHVLCCSPTRRGGGFVQGPINSGNCPRQKNIERIHEGQCPMTWRASPP